MAFVVLNNLQLFTSPTTPLQTDTNTWKTYMYSRPTCTCVGKSMYLTTQHSAALIS